MNALPFKQQIQIVGLLVEGMSIRSIERITGTHRNTICRLNKRLGDACARFHHARMRSLQINTLELDETWSFVFKKQRRVRADDPAAFGDAYLWIAFDPVSKLIISYLVGKRTTESAQAFATDIWGRLLNRPQIITDAFAPYADVMPRVFGTDLDYVMLHRKSGEIVMQTGRPDLSWATTNHVERMNLTVRTNLRRHTRGTNAHSKTLEHHQAAVALMIAVYNWTRVHDALRVTPAMEFGLARHIWSIEELIEQARAMPEEIPPLPQPPSPPQYPRPGREPYKLRVISGGKMR